MANNLRLLSNLTKGNFCYNNFQCFKYLSRYKDPAKQVAVTTSQNPMPDYLLQDLKNATSPRNVLELVGTHHQIMNSKQLIQALRSLFTLQKYGNSNVSVQQIISHPNFEKLCSRLKSHAGSIELNETVEALKVVSYMGVNSNSTIVQVLLQLLRHNINDLNLQNIVFLDFLLRQFNSSPLVDALLIALPIVFEVNLPVKMSHDNAAHLAEYLQYVSKKSISANCVELITNSLMKFFEKPGAVDVKTAKSIVWSLCDMEADEFFEPLFNKAMEAVLVDFESLDYREMQTTLTKTVFKYSSKYPFYYNETLLDLCANYIVDNDMGFEEAAYTLRKFIRVDHNHDNLLNYVSKLCHKNPEVLHQMPLAHLFNIAAAVALTEFRPVCWESLKDVLSQKTLFKEYYKRDILWLKFAASLCALNIYNFDVLEQAFNKGYIENSFKHNFVGDLEYLILLNQAVTIFEPDYKHLLPLKEVINSALSKIKPVLEYPLEGALQKALGGENYLKTCIRTQLGHHIDHVVVMRKGGYPIPLNKDIQYLEDIETPTDGFIISILALGPQHYTLNSRRLKATSALMIKTLEAKGCIVVPVCLQIWEVIADFEKIPYLMQAIRLKTENQSEVSNAAC